MSPGVCLIEQRFRSSTHQTRLTASGGGIEMPTLLDKCRGFVTMAWRRYRLWRIRRATERNVRELRRLIAGVSATNAEAQRMTSREAETADMVSRFPAHDGWSVETASGEICGWVPRGLLGGDERMPEA